MKRLIAAAFVSGSLFGLGLAVSRMTDPERVLGFLDVTGDWDPSLMFVLGGAVLTTTVFFRLVLKRDAPVLADRFRLPSSRDVDRRLVGGSVLFGIGWGLAGYCPGPALAGLGVASKEVLWFLPAMVVGMVLHRTLSRS